MQDPSAVAKPAAPPTSTTPAAPPPAAPPQIFNLGAIASLSGLLAPQGLTPAQQKHRARVQAAVDFLARVHREAAALGQTADKSRARAWCASVRGLGRQNELGDVAAGLRTVLETAQGDDGRLRESVFPRAELGKMLLSGERIREVLKGFEAGHEIVRTEATDDIGPLVKIVKVLTEMSTFFGGH